MNPLVFFIFLKNWENRSAKNFKKILGNDTTNALKRIGTSGDVIFNLVFINEENINCATQCIEITINEEKKKYEEEMEV